ncbi:MAG: hypothetical protein D6769_00845 [Methanobacteriota archaeon]|nr:MAG: hypothetical protein D6769_00845 [Euryarchaeota archaeon]
MVKVSEIYGDFTRKPLAFVFPLIAYGFYTVMALFVMLFFFMNLEPLMEVFNVGSYSYIMAGILFLVWFYLASGFKGGMIKGLYEAIERRGRFDTEDYLNYSLNNDVKFFIIYLVGAIANVLVIGPVAYGILQFSSLVIQIVLAIVGLFILFIVNYLLFYSAMTLVVYNGIGSIKAIVASIKVSVKEIFKLMGPYLLYVGVLLTMFIPLINIISIFVLYPIALGNALGKLKEVRGAVARYA